MLRIIIKIIDILKGYYSFITLTSFKSIGTEGGFKFYWKDFEIFIKAKNSKFNFSIKCSC